MRKLTAMCIERPLTICATVKTWLPVTSLGDKDQSEPSYRLHYRETCTPTFAEHDIWAIRRSQPVQVDQLVSYPLVFHSSKV